MTSLHITLTAGGVLRRKMHGCFMYRMFLTTVMALAMASGGLMAQDLTPCGVDTARWNFPDRISIGGCKLGSNTDIIHILNADVPGARSVMRITSPVAGQQNDALAQIGFYDGLSSIADSSDLVIRTADSDNNTADTYNSGDIILSANHSGGQIRLATYDDAEQKDIERVTIDSLVGINTTTPTRALTVVADQDRAAIEFGYNGNVGRLYANASFFGFRDGNGDTRLAINQSGGDIGIGTTDAQTRLDVRGGDVSVGNNDWFVGRNNAGNDHVKLIKAGTNDHVYVGGSGDHVHLAHNGGNVGIGDVSSPSEALVVDGNVVPKTNGTKQVGTETVRWNKGYSKNGWFTTSDIRFKDNIEDLSYGLNEVLQLNPIAYTWKDEPDGKRYIGLIAQEVQERISEAVATPEDPALPLAVDYSDVIPVLVKAIQEQQAIIERQEKELQNERRRNDAQQATLAAIGKRLEALEAGAGDPTSIERDAENGHVEATRGARLFSCRPNPFGDETYVRLHVPQTVRAASLAIFETATGREAQRLHIAQRGEATVRVGAQDLHSGTYTCTLIVDGQVIGSDTLIVLK